jgi:hypothetical protein
MYVTRMRSALSLLSILSSWDNIMGVRVSVLGILESHDYGIVSRFCRREGISIRNYRMGIGTAALARAVCRAGKAMAVLLHSPTQAQYIVLTGRIHDRQK